MEEAKSVSLFREFLRIRTDQPAPNTKEAFAFLQTIFDEIGLECTTAGTEPYVILIATWEGSEPSLPSIMLNSHWDVVPAVYEHWNVDPFSAYKDEKGDIYGRGTQDMKSVCIQYLEALRRLKSSGLKLRRSVHLTFMPDEELGGVLGMGQFVKTEQFRKMNVGVCLDEGLASPNEIYTVFYGQRAAAPITLTATGPTGHGSRFVQGTAVEKLMKAVQKMLQFRQEMYEKLEKGKHECGMKLGEVVTMNLTVLKAGVTGDGGKTFSVNVIPTEAEAQFDVRIPPAEYEATVQKIREWTEGLVEVTYRFEHIPPSQLVSETSEDSVWWKTFSGALTSLGLKYETEIFPAGNDGRFVRTVGIPVFGFSPIINTTVLLHDHNEFLNEKVFERGIDIYCHIIRQIASL